MSFEHNPQNPHGLGDPNDTKLRNVEREVLIPKIMRDRAKVEHCAKEVADFEECCKSSSIFMVATCRKQNSALRDCLAHWYQDETFKAECKAIYLQERADYRSTGIPKKNRVEKI
ncbi:COX assembly mitochondrial protein homolog [Drosophila grimshawi]|uniref:COX assembly mitochondrial protein n=1 Tax=Drosophila grimshawi TaxID=7222 RepID=B4JEH9_DROGR|nr:COX assembly mitochondrial protein homolog [Drosophila grimshawi]EDW03699.1 GH10361 [Drosophila grimshawi]